MDGFLLVTPLPMPAHQLIGARLVHVLLDYLGEAATVVTPGVLQRPPSTHLGPDLLVFARPVSFSSKWTESDDHWLAVEIYSPRSWICDHDDKRDAYPALGRSRGLARRPG
jgi:Uma2 family endonuclease